MATARYLVEGRVQGVGFRAATRAQAVSLGLAGHARNLADGRVEVLAMGEPAAIASLARWLADGPPLACVVRVQELGPVAPSDAEPDRDRFAIL